MTNQLRRSQKLNIGHASRNQKKDPHHYHKVRGRRTHSYAWLPQSLTVNYLQLAFSCATSHRFSLKRKWWSARCSCFSACNLGFSRGTTSRRYQDVQTRLKAFSVLHYSLAVWANRVQAYRIVPPCIRLATMEEASLTSVLHTLAHLGTILQRLHGFAVRLVDGEGIGDGKLVRALSILHTYRGGGCNKCRGISL